jgi:RNA polymerase sigma factor (sigma-70 family)
VEESDADLMERVRQRDADAFDLLYDRHREGIRRHLLQIIPDAETASDVLQEVFVRVWTHAEQWDGRGKFTAWLFRAATNRAISYLRSARWRKEQSLDEGVARAGYEEGPAPVWMIETEVYSPEVIVSIAEERVHYERLVAHLPAKQRVVFQMAHEAEMDLREIAETLGIPEGTVKSRLFYARRWLARAYARREHNEE